MHEHRRALEIAQQIIHLRRSLWAFNAIWLLEGGRFMADKSEHSKETVVNGLSLEEVKNNFYKKQSKLAKFQ